MSDPDRLQQLRRQRAAIAEHLGWLDQEIKRETLLSPDAAVVQPTATPQTAPKLKIKPREATPSPAQAVTSPPQLEANNPSAAITADPDAVLEEWTETSGASSDQPISKTGCWIIFAALAVIGVGGGIALIYLVYG